MAMLAWPYARNGVSLMLIYWVCVASFKKKAFPTSDMLERRRIRITYNRTHADLCLGFQYPVTSHTRKVTCLIFSVGCTRGMPSWASIHLRMARHKRCIQVRVMNWTIARHQGPCTFQLALSYISSSIYVLWIQQKLIFHQKFKYQDFHFIIKWKFWLMFIKLHYSRTWKEPFA